MDFDSSESPNVEEKSGYETKQEEEIKSQSPQAPSLSHILNTLSKTLRKSCQHEECRVKIKSCADMVSSLRTIIVSSFFIVVVLIIFCFIFKDIRKDAIIVEPFQVPRDIEIRNITGIAMSNKLLDHLEIINTVAKGTSIEGTFSTQKALNIESPEARISLPRNDITVPDIGISMQSISQIIKGLFGINQTRVVGEVYLQKNQLNVTIRVDGKPAKNIPGDFKNLDNIMAQAAEHVFLYVQPVILANYLYDKNTEACLKTVQFILENNTLDDRWRAYNLWGAILLKQGNADEAIVKYEKAAELKPKNASIYSNWGIALDFQGLYQEAIEKYKKAIDLDPKDTTAYSNLGIALMKQGRYQEAIDRYKKAIDLDPKDAITYSSWGVVLEMQGDHKGAISKYQKAIELNPQYAIAYANLGLALKTQGDYTGAIVNYKRAIELDPKNAIAYSNWGVVLELQGYYKGAIAKYQKAIKLDATHAPSYLNWGNALMKQGHDKEAIAKYQKAIELDPKNSSAYFNWGVVLETQGDYKGAIAKYQKAVDLNPKGELGMKATKIIDELKEKVKAN